MAADPVVGYMNADEICRTIERSRDQMVQAAKRMEFIEAARLRDEIEELEIMLANKEKQKG